MSEADRFVNVQVDGDLAIVRFRWPGNRASAGLQIIEQLEEFFDEQRRYPSKVVVFVAPPETVEATNLELCDEVEDEVSQPELMQRMIRRENILQRLIMAIREADPFVVAVVDGAVALRAAAPLLACDYRIAAAGATFQYGLKRHPVAPAGGVFWFLSRLAGSARTVQLVVDGASVSARDAQDMGFVDLVVSEADFEAEALDRARRLASLPRATLRQLKHGLVNACGELKAYFESESKLLAQVTASMLRESGK